MGVIDGKICPTDGMDNRFCPGYFGHIELAKPVFHIQYLALILKILKCVCFRCSKLLINKDDPEIKDILKILKGRNRWNYIIDRCSKVKILVMKLMMVVAHFSQQRFSRKLIHFVRFTVSGRKRRIRILRNFKRKKRKCF